MVVLSGAINILGITLSLFTMQVYDRVLSSRNLDSLFFLAIAAALALVTAATLDGVRSMTLGRIGEWLMQRLGPIVLSRSIERRMVDGNLRTEMVREISQLRTFVSGPGVPAILDIPWMPIYLVVAFLIHPLLGLLSVIGMMTLFGLAWLNEKLNGPKMRQASALSAQVFRESDSIMRNAEVIDSMGMSPQVVRRWSRTMGREILLQDGVQQRNSVLVSITRLTRSLLQVGLYMTAAILVLEQQLTGGAMMAASIVMSRLLSPMESMFVHWRSLLMIREIHSHLKIFLGLPPLRAAGTELPQPRGDLAVERVTLNMPGHPAPILRGVDFTLKAGEHLAIVGPAASGKTTLSRIILGILRPTQGAARLDGMDVSIWRREDLGRHIGYLPQDVELFAGTVAQNIGRFTRCPDSEIIRAARMAGCHQLIVGLPNGYDTEIGDGGYLLSGGQRQQVGLARALFGRPRLIVLDEPNSNLDTQGERALKSAMERLHEAGVTVVVVTHRQALIGQVDKLLVLQAGMVKAFGPVDEVVGGMRRGADSGVDRDSIPARTGKALADKHRGDDDDDPAEHDQSQEIAA
jgi:PrtD family type I secretion system ABC transporter